MAIPRLSNILRAYDKTIKEVPTGFNQYASEILDKKPYLNKPLGIINEAFKDTKIAVDFKQDAKNLLNIDEDTIKRVYNSVDNSFKTREFTKGMTISGVTDKQFFNNARTFTRQLLRSFEFDFKQSYRRYEQGLVQYARTKGVETETAFNMLVKTPAKFEKLYNIGQEDIAAYIFDKKTAGIKPVDDIINLFIDSDKAFINSLKDSGVFIGQLDNYFLPFYVPPDSFHILGRQNLRDLLLDTLVIKTKSVDGLISSISKEFATYNKDGLPLAVFEKQKYPFKDGAAMVRFFETLHNKDFKLNLFNEYFMHKQKLTRLAAMRRGLGTNPVDILNSSILKARSSLGGKIDPTLNNKYKSLIKDTEMRMQVLNGERFIDSEFWSNVSTAMNHTMSIVTAAPARSTVRNLFIDYEANALSVGNGLYNTDYKLGGSATRIAKSFSYLLNQTLGGKENKEAINNILDIAGWANSFDGLTHSNVLAFEDVLDTRAFNKTDGATVSKYVADKLASIQDSLFRYSGNHSLIDMVRARRFMGIQQLFTNVLSHRSYDDWLNSLTGLERKQATTLMKQYGFDNNMFDFLKVATKVENIKASKFLPHKHLTKFISKESILKTPDNVVNNFKLSTETPDIFRRRIAANWQRFVYNTTQLHAPSTTVVDSLTVPLTYRTPLWFSLTLRPFIKFADVAHSQWNNLVETVGVSVYGRPTDFVGFDGSLLKWSNALLKYTAFAAAGIWTKDILNNRQPTNFRERDNAIRLLAISGMGGVYNMVAAQTVGIFPSKDSSIYATTPIGASIASIKRIGKSFTSSDPIGELSTALHKANPYTQLWYASGLVDKLLTETLLQPNTKRQRARRFEKYGKPYIF